MISLSKALSRAYQRDAKTKWEISPPPPQPLFAVVRFCLFQELMILFSEAYEIQASKNIKNNWDHKKARYKLVFSITIKIYTPDFLIARSWKGVYTNVQMSSQCGAELENSFEKSYHES